MKYKKKLIQKLLQRKTLDPARLLIGPKTPYKPQTEKTTMKPVTEPMNVTKALTSLGMVTGRGMDNGQAVSSTEPNHYLLYIIFQGAQILANQVAVVIKDLEEKRVDYIKLQNKMNREKDNNVKAFKV